MFPSVLRHWPIFVLLDLQFVSTIHMTFVYGNRALIVTNDGMVYKVAKYNVNLRKPCKHRINNPRSIFYPKKIDELCGKDIKSFVYFNPYLLVLTEEGEVFIWESNENSDTSAPFKLPPVRKNSKVVQIACTIDNLLVLTNGGKVYHIEQQNINSIDKMLKSSRTVFIKDANVNSDKIVSIACGSEFTVAILNNGRVCSWGCNKYGTLGIGDCCDVYVEDCCYVKSLTEIVKVACGQNHVLALSKEGVIFAWGCNSAGQLGHTRDMESSFPHKVEIPETIEMVDIAASKYNTSAAMDINKRIYIWGLYLGESIYVPTVTSLRCLHHAFLHSNIMHEPLVVHDDGETFLRNSLREAFDDPTTSDLAIQVQGKMIHVHKILLKLRSPYFSMMFKSHWREDTQSVIKIKEYSYDVYKIFLKYLYTDKVDIPNNIEELMEIASVCLEDQLKRHCIQFMKDSLTVANVTSFYRISIKFDADDLTGYCLRLAMRHMTEVIKTPDFNNLNANELRIFLKRATEMGVFNRVKYFH